MVLTWTEDKNDPQFEISNEAYEVLTRATDAQGRRLKIHKIHQPGPLFISKSESQGFDAVEDAKLRKQGDRLAGSYINFYMANKGIVMPLFDDPRDNAALAQMQKFFRTAGLSGYRRGKSCWAGGISIV